MAHPIAVIVSRTKGQIIHITDCTMSFIPSKARANINQVDCSTIMISFQYFLQNSVMELINDCTVAFIDSQFAAQKVFASSSQTLIISHNVLKNIVNQSNVDCRNAFMVSPFLLVNSTKEVTRVFALSRILHVATSPARLIPIISRNICPILSFAVERRPLRDVDWFFIPQANFPHSFVIF